MDENREINEEITPCVTNSEMPPKPRGVTMEVPLFLSFLSIALSGAVISNLIFYRTCKHSLGHSEEDCRPFLSPDKAHMNKTIEENVQQYAAFVRSVNMVLESVMPATLSFFLGVWSDKHGRKPLVTWPLLGITSSMALVVLYAMEDNLGPWWILLTAIPFSLSGGFGVLITGATCFIADITSSENISFRMTMLDAAVSIGMIIGSVASSYLLRAVGNLYLLLIATTLFVIAYTFTQVWLTESLTGATQGGLSSALDFSLVKEMVRECFKQRPNYVRGRALLLIFANIISTFIMCGLINLEYMYTRNKLHWSMKDFTIYSGANTSITFVGSLIGVVLVQKLLRLSDSAFAIISYISSTTEFIIKTFAEVTWHMYLGAGLSLFKGLSSPLTRSLMAKTLPPEDIGKFFSLMGAIAGICPLLAPVVYSSLYAVSLSTFPMSIYVLSCGLTLVSLGMLMIVQYFSWRAASYRPLQED